MLIPIIKVTVKYIIILLLQYPFQWCKWSEDWFYEIIRLTFCKIVNPLQLSEYLREQNCLTLTDLVCNINNKTVRYVMFNSALFLEKEGFF